MTLLIKFPQYAEPGSEFRCVEVVWDIVSLSRPPPPEAIFLSKREKGIVGRREGELVRMDTSTVRQS